LLESVADGKTWPRRFSSFEATHNQHAQVRNSWLKLLQDLGYSPRFVSEEEKAAIFPQLLAGNHAPFDLHGRFVKAMPDQTPSSYARERLSKTFDGSHSRSLVDQLMPSPLPPALVKIPPEARVRTHRFTVGKDTRLLAFERNIDYKISEDLAQAGGNQELEKPVTFTATWNGDSEVYDLRTGNHLGRTNQIEVHLDPWQPSLYALLPKAVEGDVVEALSH
jgi:hypothetical protein